MKLYSTFTTSRAITVGEYNLVRPAEPVWVWQSEMNVYLMPLAAIYFDTAVVELICSSMLLLLGILARMITPLDARGNPKESAADDEAHTRIDSKLGTLYIFGPRRNGHIVLRVVSSINT